MVNSFTESLFRSKQERKEQEKQSKLVEQKAKEVRKGLLELDDNFKKTVKVIEEVAKSTSDKTQLKELNKSLKEAKDAIKTLEEVKKKGKEVSEDQIKKTFSAADNLSTLLKENEDVKREARRQGLDSDPSKVISKFTNNINTSFKGFVTDNIKNISSQGVNEDLAKSGINAVSAELGFITQGLGINLSDSFSSLFADNEEDLSEDILATNKVKESVEELADITKKSQADSTNKVTNAIQASNHELASILTNGNSQAANTTEALMEQAEEHHKANIEALDEVNDSVDAGTRVAMFKGLFGGLLRGLSGVFGKILGSLGLGGLAKTLSEKLGVGGDKKNKASKKSKAGKGPKGTIKSTPPAKAGKFAKVGTGLKTGAKALAPAMMLAGPIIAATAAAAIGVQQAHKAITTGTSDISDAINSTETGIKATQFIGDSIGAVFEGHKKAVNALSKGIENTVSLYQTSVDFVSKGIDKTVGLHQSVVDSMSKGIENTVSLHQGAVDSMSKGMESLGTFFSSTYQSAVDSMSQAIESTMNSIKSVRGVLAGEEEGPDNVNRIGANGKIESVPNQFKTGGFGFIESALGINQAENDAAANALAPTILPGLANTSSTPITSRVSKGKIPTGIDTNIQTLQQMQTQAVETSNNNIINKMQSQQVKMQESQTKITREIIKETSKEKNMGSKGRINHDNSPLISTDFGLVGILGGGI